MDLTGSAFRVADRSNAAEIRRAVGGRARAMGWDQTACGRGELLATELATNLVKHARDGVVAIASPPQTVDELVVVAVDRGPGIRDVGRSFEDGYSTSGSPGTGLGAVQRLAHEVDVVSAPDGTVTVAELRNRSTRNPYAGAQPFARVAGIVLAKEGQFECGDAWAHRWLDGRLAVVVCDGLGHGYEASKAAARAVECFLGDGWDTPQQMLALANEALRPTRGAAAAVAVVDARLRKVTFCGVGNIVAGIVADGQAHHLVSHNGILGTKPRIAEFVYDWPAGATLLMHSDGLLSRWPLPRWERIWNRHPALVAGLVYRDLLRGTDDVAVVVAREHAGVT